MNNNDLTNKVKLALLDPHQGVKSDTRRILSGQRKHSLNSKRAIDNQDKHFLLIFKYSLIGKA